MPLPANLHFVMTTASCLTEHRGPIWGSHPSDPTSPNGIPWPSGTAELAWEEEAGARRCREMTSLVTGWRRFLAPNPRGFRVPKQGGRDCEITGVGPKSILTPKMDGLTWFNARNCHTWGPYTVVYWHPIFFHFFSISIDWRCVVPIEWWFVEASSGWISYEITWNIHIFWYILGNHPKKPWRFFRIWKTRPCHDTHMTPISGAHRNGTRLSAHSNCGEPSLRRGLGAAHVLVVAIS